MKGEIQVEKLKEAALITERMTGKNLSLPVLSSILFIARENRLTLRATNISIGIEYTLAAKIEKEGVVAVKGSTLSQFLGNLNSSQTIFFELIGETLVFKTKTSKVTLKTFHHDDFPTIPRVSGETFTLPSKKLIEGFMSVSTSAAVSDIRPEIASVHLYQEESKLIFVATDSFRLSEKKIEIKGLYDFPNILLPIKNTLEIIRAIELAGGDVVVKTSKNLISFETDGLYISSRVIDGLFPDYKQIIPQTTTTEAIVLKQDLQNALKTSTVFSDKFNQVSFVVKPKEKLFEISSKNTDIGENNQFVHATLSGEDIEVNFNYRYITDALQSLPADSVSLSFSGGAKAMSVRGIGDKNFLALIMPMNR